MKREIEGAFRLLCEQAGRQGVIGFVPIKGVRLLPEQEAYLRHKLNGLGSEITAVSIGLFYHESEILAIPAGWVSRPPEDGLWNRYARAYKELNQQLNVIATQLAEQFGGVAEQATMEGMVGQVNHVNDYFPHCVSHRAFAEAARVGWRGKHGLVVTPEAGPALRLATLFIPQHLLPDDRHLSGCGDCNACLEVCPILRPEEGYRERCRRRLKALGLEDEVCGICMRVCWEANQQISKSANQQISIIITTGGRTMTEVNEAARPLLELQPRHEFFVGIDSDGCAFDTMEIKQKECFTPTTIKYWGLQPVSKYAREVALFVNLYSRWRGINRWPALVMVFDLLRERPEVIRRGVNPPQALKLREFIESGFPLSNEGLRAYMAEHPDPELERGLAWSEAINAAVADMVHGVPPFPYVRQSLEMMQDKADIIVVSATPGEALQREWEEHDIAKYVRVIAGQEMGSKTEHLKLAAVGKYAPDHILMIGDAPGDMKAAKTNNALFFPINPGYEEESWQRFYEEGFHKFIAGEYAGQYEASLIAEFEKLLPEVPPWRK